MTLNLTHFTNYTNHLTITISEANYLESSNTLIHTLLDFLTYKPYSTTPINQIGEFASTFGELTHQFCCKLTITSNNSGELLLELKNGNITFENPLYLDPTPPTNHSGGRVSIGKNQPNTHSINKKKSTYTAYMIDPNEGKYWNCDLVSCSSFARLAQYAHKCARARNCTVNIVCDETGEIIASAKHDDIAVECYFEKLNHSSSFNPSKVPYYHKLVNNSIWFSPIERSLANSAWRARRLHLSMPLIHPECKCDNPVVVRGQHFGNHHYETINHWAWNNCLTRRIKGTFYCESDYEAFILAEHGWKIRREEKPTMLTNPGTGANWETYLWIVENT